MYVMNQRKRGGSNIKFENQKGKAKQGKAVKWVQPNLCLAAHFLSSPLGLQHTLLFKNKSEEQQQPWVWFFWRRKNGGCCGCLFLEQKRRLLWVSLLGAENWLCRVRFSGKKKEVCWAFSGAQKSAAAIFLLQQNNLIYTAGLGEIFINLFLI